MYIILPICILIYVGAGAWTFGYMRGILEDKENGWHTPFPLLSAIFCPLILLALSLKIITSPISDVGFMFQQKRLAKTKKRIAEQEKIRIELQDAEKEIEKLVSEMDREEFAELEIPKVKTKKMKK